MNYYNLLGVPFDATQDEIRKAYFDSAKKYHPDIQTTIDLKERFIQIQNAYETLKNEEKRQEYNGQLGDLHKHDKDIQINAYYSRSVIPKLNGPQAFYLLLDIFSTQKVEEKDLPAINLCLVLDKSTSMQGSIMDKLKKEIVNLIRELKDEDIISIVTFSDRAEILLPPVKVKDIGNEIGKIYSIFASGSTEILKGLNEGFSVLRNLDNYGAKLLYLITDGHTYGDEEECIKIVRETSEEGIIFQAVGVGKDWNDDFLDNLSKISGGETQFVSSSNELYTLLKNKIHNFGILFSKAVKISFNLHPKVKINYAFRVSPDLSRLESGSEIHLGSLYTGKHVRVVFELVIEELPMNMDEIRLSSGSIKIDIPSNIINMKRYFYDFRRPVSHKIEEEKIPPILIKSLSSLSLYRLQEKAHEDVKAGNYNNATRRLQNLATNLIGKGNRDLAKTVMQEIENLENNNPISELGKKKIKYGTRSLLMLPEPSREEP
ncbi:MAG: DnaJ domain-containing protein [Anaerolineaceae bacterium]|jgi:Ca-activated chloride channel family protein|nr:DnaJ domain-containing protein [Anaerolineaceae bacterium]